MSALKQDIEDFGPDAQADPARPIRVVVAGEVNSGKSSVINALLRKEVLPDFFGLEQRPVVELVYAAEPFVEATERDGGETRPFAHIDDIPDLSKIEQLKLGLDLETLVGLEINEITMEDDCDPEEAQLLCIAAADILIWTTIASQAWRLSEKTILESVEDIAPKHSILTVTRTDKLRSASDMDKLSGRLDREASPSFDEIIYMHASSTMIEKSGGCDKSWTDTNGRVVFSTLGTFRDKIIHAESQPSNEAEEKPHAAQIAIVSSEADADDEFVDEEIAVEAEQEVEVEVEDVAPAAPTIETVMAATSRVTDDVAAAQTDEGDDDVSEPEIAEPESPVSGCDELAAIVAATNGVLHCAVVKAANAELCWNGCANDDDLENAINASHNLMQKARTGFDDADGDGSIQIRAAEQNWQIGYFANQDLLLMLICDSRVINAGIAKTVFDRLSNTLAAGVDFS